MIGTNAPQILANIPPDQFVGREAELGSLLTYARLDAAEALSLAKAPGSGATELLLQVFDELFREQGEVIPVYFRIDPADADLPRTAERAGREMLAQIVAFRRNEPRILSAAYNISDLIEQAPAADSEWVHTLANPATSLLEVLSAPLRVSQLGVRVLMMIDDIENIAMIQGAERVLSEFIKVLSRSRVPYLFAGARRSVFGKLPGETIHIKRLPPAGAAEVAAVMSKRFSVELTEQTRDLIAVQMSGDLACMADLFSGAAGRKEKLDNFTAVESAYAEEIFGGRVSRSLEEKVRIAVPDETMTAVLDLIRQSFDEVTNSLPRSAWRRTCDLDGDTLRQMLARLHMLEIVNCSAGRVTVDPENYVLRDYVLGRGQLETRSSRALVYGESLSNYIKRGSQLLGRYYRRNAAIGLKGLLNHFDGQEVAAEFLDYGKFSEVIKGLPADETSEAIKASATRMRLPHIVFAADTSAFYPSLGELIDDERSAIAIGFEDDSQSEDSVWMAAEIESKLEADAETAEFWADRLEMAATNCGFNRFTIWLVSPEGFTTEALELLRSRNAIGSSRHQVDLLRSAVAANDSDTQSDIGDEYEMIIPMGDDTEMIAARTLEDIARKHEFPSRTINQMKTALVEACINAGEHSLSPDGRIYQKFRVTDTAVEITVANRGLRLQDKVPAPSAGNGAARRGWGLKLMQSLMDEVRIEPVDDGTRITMIKNLPRGENQSELGR